ncbi:RNA-directed DNA polymerase, eukaryota, reverse transcriptase zinc-binding domain protein [Tanacetum coccineum]
MYKSGGCGFVQSNSFSSIFASLHLSHMFYADDVIFMGQCSESNIDTIVKVLECFHRASGLRINMSKSKLLGISVEVEKVEQAAAKIGCTILNTPFTYLGSKVGGFMSRIHSWKETMEGMVTRLSKWKLKALSIGGRLTLLKSILGSMSIYHMSIFKTPMKILQRMESLRSLFFNDVDSASKKPTWVKWKDVLVIIALHGEDGKFGNKSKTCYSSIWLDIINEVERFKSRGLDLVSFIHLKLGNGKNTSFWEVAWCRDTPFKVLYPRMFGLETQKNIDVVSKMSHCGLDSSFRRAPRGGVEQNQFEMLKDKVEGYTLVNKNDRWVWSLEGSGEFSVSSVKNLIDGFTLPEVSTKTRWIKEVPIKVNVHAWKVKLDCLPTRLNISRRGMDIDSILCPMCDKAVESSRHIFFTCPVLNEALRKISRWWDIEYKEVSSYEEWLQWLLTLRLSWKHKNLFEGVCYVLWWHVWSFRNKSIFGNQKSFKADIFDDVVSHSFTWCRHGCKTLFSWSEWFKNPHIITF